MNKRLITGVMAIIMGMSMGSVALASDLQEVNKVAIESTQEALGGFMAEEGQVCIITEGTNSYELQVGNEEGTIFYLEKDLCVFDMASRTFKKPKDIKKDMTVSIVYPKNAPMTLSLPARCSEAKLIVIHSETENLEIGYFNDALVNEKNTLALNISENTIIKSILDDKKLLKAEDIKNKDAMVVYENTTRSIPAQTTPKLVLILEEELEQEVNIEDEDKPSYIGVRSLADENGFEITWNSLKKVATLTKDDVQIVLTVGEDKYFYNKQVKSLKYPVKLENGCMKIADEIFN